MWICVLYVDTHAKAGHAIECVLVIKYICNVCSCMCCAYNIEGNLVLCFLQRILITTVHG